ncbi:MAG: nucleoside triphosphate pyrophosphohydrolase family protein [Candidatus Saccharibacteria bacterium]|nr:nucleoside triphosphate pyrophosphohydrolase family protein [Candidatus Saccharibacteria bacterium]
MNIQEYADKAISTLTTNYAHGQIDAQLMGQILGLCGESGEVAEKFKKLLRDKQGMMSDEDRAEIVKELGDILWYINAVAHLIGSNLEEVARVNNDKLASRQQRDQLQGSGDNR